MGLGLVTGRAGDYRHEGRASLDDFAVLEDDHVRCVPDSGTAAALLHGVRCMLSAYMLYAVHMLHVACCTYCCMLYAPCRTVHVTLCVALLTRPRVSKPEVPTPRPHPRAHEPRARQIGLTPHQQHWRADALDG